MGYRLTAGIDQSPNRLLLKLQPDRLEVNEKHFYSLIAIGSVFAQGSLDDVSRGSRGILKHIVSSERLWLLFENASDQGPVILAAKWFSITHALVEHDAKRPDIATLVGRPPAKLFRRHIG